MVLIMQVGDRNVGSILLSPSASEASMTEFFMFIFRPRAGLMMEKGDLVMILPASFRSDL